jgi:hypothetical protein
MIDKWGERISRWLVVLIAAYVFVMIIVKWVVPNVLP